ncbi:MAG: hypothetical protein HY851_10115 [candidate division Zixibacteria bacterium]|nr:hypothetical protein [candidate division Zixibacteria bacterium]
MKHFIVEIIYSRPFEEISEVVPDHRAYLQTGYQRGLLLMSGPQSPRVGGILIARGETLEEIRDFCDRDPYAKAGVATHRIIEFIPMSYQPYLEPWATGK